MSRWARAALALQPSAGRAVVPIGGEAAGRAEAFCCPKTKEMRGSAAKGKVPQVWGRR